MINLMKNGTHLTKLLEIFPQYEIDNFWCSTVLCDACSRAVRRFSPSSKAPLPASFQAGEKYLSAIRHKSVRQAAIEGHRNCSLCEIANPSSVRGCMKISEGFPPLEKSDSKICEDSFAQKPVSISHEDLKRIQVENGLTQNQIIGVLQGLRYASHGLVTTPPGFKKFLEEKNRLFEDIYKVLVLCVVACGVRCCFFFFPSWC